MRYSLKFVWQDISRYFKPLILNMISVKEGTDYVGTLQSLRENSSIRGAEFWLLICAVVLVSVGMDINSSAVIIAGILLTPILKPIIGIGLGFGISDRDMIYSSIKNSIIITVIIFTTSAIYYLFSPLGQPSQELLIRSKPILLDVLVAFFGGVAIIINYSRQQKAISFPRVIIGFILIPPLCTSSYGLINTEPKFYFGSIYLYLLNIFFISIAIYIVTRNLNFPNIKVFDWEKKRKINRSIAIAAILMILPSSYILYDVVVQAKVERTIKVFVKKYISRNNYEVLRWDIDNEKGNSTVKVFITGESINHEKVHQLENDFSKYYLPDYKLRIIQMQVPESERLLLKQELAGEVAYSVLNQLQSAQKDKKRKQQQIDSLQGVMKELYLNNDLLTDLKNEIGIAFPEINNVRFGILGADIIDTNQKQLLPVAYLDFDDNLGKRTKNNISERVNKYLQIKFKKDSIKIVFE